jgi:hypothetical protein
MVLCVIITNGYTYSQINKSTDSLKFYGDAMFSLKFTEHRKFACEQFIYLSKLKINYLKLYPGKLNTIPKIIGIMHIYFNQGRNPFY